MEAKTSEITKSPIEARLAKKEDLNELKTIWKLCFGDPDSFIDFYFQNRNWPAETAVLLYAEKIVSMLTMIPVIMICDNGEAIRASMIYAVATHPEYRKQGFSDRLIEFCNHHLLAAGTEVTLLVPATEELFHFYEKRGYKNGFSVREASLSFHDVEKLTGQDQPESRMIFAEPEQYNHLRRKLLEGRPYLDYRDEEVAFQKHLGQMFDTKLVILEFGDSEGIKNIDIRACAYAERISQEEVIIKELLAPEQYLIPALKMITEQFPAKKYVVRTPEYSGLLLGGTVRPFGMLRTNGFGGGQAGNDSYLGIAYD